MSSNRRKIDHDVRLAVWVRAGGRCAICNRYLLESELTHRELRFGEMAHNVGQAPSNRSPRGNADLPVDERDTADNIALLCSGCHREVDKLAQVDLFPVEKVDSIKRRHESRVLVATGRVGAEDTSILRLSALIRDVPVDISPEVAAAAVLASSDRFPSLPFAYDRQGVDIDLRDFPYESAPSPLYYQSCAARIDQVMDRLVRPAIVSGEVAHLSVFAMARLPLLVYFGSRLDDAIDCDIYERRSTTAPWIWADDSERVDFEFRCDRTGEPTATDAVLIINASGTTCPIPTELTGLARYIIRPRGVVPQVGTVGCRATLASFERALRSLLGELEQSAKGLTRLHLFAAAPVSVAITVGRTIGWGIHPNLVTYDLIDSNYQFALEITPP